MHGELAAEFFIGFLPPDSAERAVPTAIARIEEMRNSRSKDFFCCLRRTSRRLQL